MRRWRYFIFCFCFLFLLPVHALADECRIGLDRIDAATLGQSSQGDWPSILMEKTAETNAKCIKMWIPWETIDYFAPTLKKPKESDGYIVVPGIRTKNADGQLLWHQYRVAELDRVIAEARRLGLEVALGIHGPPEWPRGDKACPYDWETVLPCGIISLDHYGIFSDAVYDVTYYMAVRYAVHSWLVYNEPNLPYAFLPEQPRFGSLLDLYMLLVYEPMRDALYDALGFSVQIVGPEITMLDVRNDFGQTRWLEDWIIPILERYPHAFDVISVHNYGVDADQMLKKMDRLKAALEAHPNATQRVWTTEFDIGSDKESLTRTPANVFLNLLVLRSSQWWERQFYFTFLGRLVSDHADSFGEELPLFPLFKALVRDLP